jgi:hypothetical protein
VIGISPIPQIVRDELPLRRLWRSSFRCLLLFLLLLASRRPKTGRGEALEQAESTFFRIIFRRQFTAPRPELGRPLCWRRWNKDLSLSRDGRGTQSSRFRHFARFGGAHDVGVRLMRQWRWRVGRHRRADIVGRVNGNAGRHHRHADDALEAFVEGRAGDDVASASTSSRMRVAASSTS